MPTRACCRHLVKDRLRLAAHQVAATFRHFALCPGIYLRKSIFKPSHIATKMCETLSVDRKTEVSQKGIKALQVLEGGNENIEVVIS